MILSERDEKTMAGIVKDANRKLNDLSEVIRVLTGRMTAEEKWADIVKYISDELSSGYELARTEYAVHGDVIRRPVLQDDSWESSDFTGRKTIQITLELRNNEAIARHYEDMQDRVSRGGKWV